MIHRFHSNDAIFHVMVVRMHVLDQVELGLPWPDHENFTGPVQGFHNLVVEVLVFGLAATADGTPFVMQVLVGIGGVDDGFFHVLGADMHDARFGMINPDDGVMMRHGFPFLGYGKK